MTRSYANFLGTLSGALAVATILFFSVTGITASARSVSDGTEDWDRANQTNAVFAQVHSGVLTGSKDSDHLAVDLHRALSADPKAATTFDTTVDGRSLYPSVTAETTLTPVTGDGTLTPDFSADVLAAFRGELASVQSPLGPRPTPRHPPLPYPHFFLVWLVSWVLVSGLCFLGVSSYRASRGVGSLSWRLDGEATEVKTLIAVLVPAVGAAMLTGVALGATGSLLERRHQRKLALARARAPHQAALDPRVSVAFLDAQSSLERLEALALANPLSASIRADLERVRRVHAALSLAPDALDQADAESQARRIAQHSQELLDTRTAAAYGIRQANS